MFSNYWNSNTEPSTIFHWRELLENWNNSYSIPYPVDTVLENLERVREANLTSYQFKKYLNFTEEDEGMKWFLYECIMRKPQWNSLQFCTFLRGITDEVMLDTGFPNFPGSPRGITARAFIETHLSGLEIDYLDLLPGLVPLTTRPLPSSESSSASTSPVRTNKSKEATMQIRIIRNINSRENEDDRITFTRTGDNLFKYTYIDPTAEPNGAKMVVDKLTSDDVIEHLSRSLHLITLDSIPFEAVQLLIPGYPSVMLPVKKLTSSTRDLIYETVESTMDNWPLLA